MKQTKKIEIIEQLSANEMMFVKGGTSLESQTDQPSESTTQPGNPEYYVYINGKRYRVTSRGLEPV